jgi:hypothetical protein
VKSISELNKLKVRLFVEAVWNEGRMELIDELIAADYLGRFPCKETGVAGPDGVRRLVASRRRAHPGLYVKIEDQIAEDDRVVTRWTATATGPGARRVGAAAGRDPCCAGISIIRLLAGKQIDSHTECTDSVTKARTRVSLPARPAETPSARKCYADDPFRSWPATAHDGHSNPRKQRHNLQAGERVDRAGGGGSRG